MPDWSFRRVTGASPGGSASVSATQVTVAPVVEIDDLMAEIERVLADAQNSGQHVERGAGAQLVLECRMQPRGAGADRGQEVFAGDGGLEKIARRIGEAVEVIGDGEVLDDIALPGADDATIRFMPFGHAVPPS